MIFLRVRIKMKLRYNVYNNVTVKEKCCIQHRAEKYSLIMILNLTLFWAVMFLQINYTLKVMFYDVNSIVTITE